MAPHAPVSTLEDAARSARELKPDVLVSVGGGSTHDTTKGISTLLGEGGKISDYQTTFEPPDRIITPKFTSPKVPVIAVSTTMGCAELSLGGGFTDFSLGRKISVQDPGVLPRLILVDGEALATTPTDILTSTAIGELRIAIEAVYSTGHNPITDSLALGAIGTLARELPRCPEKQLSTLLSLKTACCMASMANVTGLGLNTATAHHVGGLYGVPHGVANGILLPHTMRFNLDACSDRLLLVAEAMGVDIHGLTEEEAGLAAADRTDGLCRELGIPRRLRDAGVPEEGLELIASATLHDRGLATNPKPVHDAGPIMEVLRQAW